MLLIACPSVREFLHTLFRPLGYDDARAAMGVNVPIAALAVAKIKDALGFEPGIL